MFLVWSEYITKWGNSDHPQESFPAAARYRSYPGWKFLKKSKIKGIMSPETVDLSDEEIMIKTCALQGFQPDAKDPIRHPNKEKIKVDLRKAAGKEQHDQFKFIQMEFACPWKKPLVQAKV